jgi:hypothetical protein
MVVVVVVVLLLLLLLRTGCSFAQAATAASVAVGMVVAVLA